MLFNLVGNAIKFTASGHVEIRASAVPTGEGGSTRSSSPCRIPARVSRRRIAPRIFERFKRGRGQENAGHAGLGLGLALCRENAVLMGGALTVESALGVGSEFTFEFPAERVVAAGRATSASPAGPRCWWATRTPGRAPSPANLAMPASWWRRRRMAISGMALAERIEAQRGALDLVIVQGRLVGMAAEVFVLRLRDTAFGRLAVVIWLGEGGETAQVDAIVPLPADPYQVASLAQQLLAQRSPFEVAGADGIGGPRRPDSRRRGRQGEPVAAGCRAGAPRLLGVRCQ